MAFECRCDGGRGESNGVNLVDDYTVSERRRKS